MQTNSSTHKPKKNALQFIFQTLKTSYSTKQKKNQKKEQQQWITQEKHIVKNTTERIFATDVTFLRMRNGVGLSLYMCAQSLRKCTKPRLQLTQSASILMVTMMHSSSSLLAGWLLSLTEQCDNVSRVLAYLFIHMGGR